MVEQEQQELVNELRRVGDAVEKLNTFYASMPAEDLKNGKIDVRTFRQSATTGAEGVTYALLFLLAFGGAFLMVHH